MLAICTTGKPNIQLYFVQNYLGHSFSESTCHHYLSCLGYLLMLRIVARRYIGRKKLHSGNLSVYYEAQFSREHRVLYILSQRIYILLLHAKDIINRIRPCSYCISSLLSHVTHLGNMCLDALYIFKHDATHSLRWFILL